VLQRDLKVDSRKKHYFVLKSVCSDFSCGDKAYACKVDPTI